MLIHSCRVVDKNSINCEINQRDIYNIYYFLQENSGIFVLNGNIEKIFRNRLFFIPPNNLFEINCSEDETIDCFHIQFKLELSEQGIICNNKPYTIIIPQEEREKFNNLNSQLAIASVINNVERKQKYLNHLINLLELMSMRCYILLATRNYGRIIRDIPRHQHNEEYQVDYFVSGNGTIFLDSKWVEYTNGSLCFIKPETSHEIVFSPFNMIDNYSIKFQIKDVPHINLPDKSFVLIVPDQYRTLLLKSIKCIVAEFVIDIPIQPSRVIELIQIISQILEAMEKSPYEKHDIAQQTKQLVSNHFASKLRISTLAYKIGVSPEHLSRTFKKETGQTLSSYILEQRLKAALVMMQKTNMPLKQIAVECGFSNVNYFHTCFKKYFHSTPKEILTEKKS